MQIIIGDRERNLEAGRGDLPGQVMQRIGEVAQLLLTELGRTHLGTGTFLLRPLGADLAKAVEHRRIGERHLGLAAGSRRVSRVLRAERVQRNERLGTRRRSRRIGRLRLKRGSHGVEVGGAQEPPGRNVGRSESARGGLRSLGKRVGGAKTAVAGRVVIDRAMVDGVGNADAGEVSISIRQLEIGLTNFLGELSPGDLMRMSSLSAF